ncbi:MAG: hypothetical protein R3E96_14840 [Planctomycetota bacterium]
MEPILRVQSGHQRGCALVSTLVVFTAISGLLIATAALSSVEMRQAQAAFPRMQAEVLSEAGIEVAKLSLDAIAKRTTGINPLDVIAAQFDDGAMAICSGQQLIDNGVTMGAYSVRASLISQTEGELLVRIESTGYVPDAPANLGPGQRVTAWDSQSLVLRYSFEPSEVFDYGYFINNWGWFYGNSIYCYGNVRANGQFDAGGYSPLIQGQPRYKSVAWDGDHAVLGGYVDDNGDGLQDGKDGGIWAGWDMVNEQSIRDTGGLAANQHSFGGTVEMPNLSDLSMYEDMARNLQGTISIDGITLVEGVMGDAPTEKQHLYLVGTEEKPIVINGPVVVRGDVIISGVVEGQGVIYSGGNTYVPDSIQYKHGPAQPRPALNTTSATEAWLTANKNSDFLGLFSAENIVVGDFSNSTWRSNVNAWMSSSLNQSAEDAGEDGLPNTAAGRDGILGTADDDVLEGDGVFTVEFYTLADAEAGMIPAGYEVGDVIPGSGEDIDGDGEYDGPLTLHDLDFQDDIRADKWAGNVPSGGVSNYEDIASLNASKLEATFYTNHSFCWYVEGSQDAVITVRWSPGTRTSCTRPRT